MSTSKLGSRVARASTLERAGTHTPNFRDTCQPPTRVTCHIASQLAPLCHQKSCTHALCMRNCTLNNNKGREGGITNFACAQLAVHAKVPKAPCPPSTASRLLAETGKLSIKRFRRSKRFRDIPEQFQDAPCISDRRFRLRAIRRAAALHRAPPFLPR